jgi:hypothetical protein
MMNTGEVYFGQFKNGKKHGRGKLQTVSGDVVEQFYQDGVVVDVDALLGNDSTCLSEDTCDDKDISENDESQFLQNNSHRIGSSLVDISVSSGEEVSCSEMLPSAGHIMTSNNEQKCNFTIDKDEIPKLLSHDAGELIINIALKKKVSGDRTSGNTMKTSDPYEEFLTRNEISDSDRQHDVSIAPAFNISMKDNCKVVDKTIPSTLVAPAKGQRTPPSQSLVEVSSSSSASILRTVEIDCGDGGIYKGQELNGMKHGVGELKMTDGSVYCGDFYEDKRHGQGTLLADQNTYRGEWKNDFPHGYGVLQYQNGDVYSGNFDNNKKHGLGIFVFSDGTRFEGEYVNDTMQGRGRIVCEDGETYGM